MSRVETTTNFRDSDGVDLGKKLITKDYLISVYPSIGQQIGIPPELWTWGYGSDGQLGTNTVTTKSTPVTTLAGGTNWKQVSTGRVHTASVKTDGTLWTWGKGTYGQLGDNTTTNKSTPVTTFAGGTNWKQVSSGGYHTAAIKTDGTLWTWGRGTSGQLGDNTTITRSTPVTTFAGGTNWKQVSCGIEHTAAIKTDGTLWIWGGVLAGFSNLGTNDISSRNTPVTTFAGGTNWKQISCGGYFTAAIKTDGTLWVWGYNAQGQLGTNNTITRSTPVTTFAGGTNWKQVSSTIQKTFGQGHASAIKTDGTLWTWGSGTSGQLGDNTATTKSIPVTTFAGGTNWKQVGAGGNYCAAIKTDGTLWTWGFGSDGRLGDNTATTKSIPVTTFAGGTNWKQVSVGYSHCAAIKSVDF